MVVLQHVRIGAEDADRVAEQVAEVAGVQRLQPLLIGLVELAALAVGEAAGVALGDVGGAEALVLPAVDHLRELLGRPALVVQALGLDELLDQPHDVVGVENGEVGFQPGKLGMAAQQLDADRVEGAEPRHALDIAFADQDADALLHLARGLVGEGDGEDLRREGLAGGEDVGDAGGEHARLAGAGAGQHQDRAFGGFHRQPLLGVQALQIVGRAVVAAAGRHGARGYARRGRGPRIRFVKKGHVFRKAGHRPRM